MEAARFGTTSLFMQLTFHSTRSWLKVSLFHMVRSHGRAKGVSVTTASTSSISADSVIGLMDPVLLVLFPSLWESVILKDAISSYTFSCFWLSHFYLWLVYSCQSSYFSLFWGAHQTAWWHSRSMRWQPSCRGIWTGLRTQWTAQKQFFVASSIYCPVSRWAFSSLHMQF